MTSGAACSFSSVSRPEDGGCAHTSKNRVRAGLSHIVFRGDEAEVS